MRMPHDVDTAAIDGPEPIDAEWMDTAPCRGDWHLFFAPFRESNSARIRREAAALELCGHCTLREPCREAGRANLETGIWGGETDEDRARAGFIPRAASRRAILRIRSQRSDSAA